MGISKTYQVVFVLVNAYIAASYRSSVIAGAKEMLRNEDFLNLYHESGFLLIEDKLYSLSFPTIDGKGGFIQGFANFNEGIPVEDKHEEREEPFTLRFWILVMAALMLTLFAGLMSGLTVGYLSIDTLVLELKLQNGTPEEKKNAEILMSILENNHHLLVTLLIANAGAMEALPLCLNQLVTEVIAVIISVTAVLIFGEIIPQALCTGPSQLKIAAKLAPLTKFFMMLESVLAFPLSKLLDCILGKHGRNRYQNSDLKTLILLHSKNTLQEIEENEGDPALGLEDAQIRLINGTIDLISLTAKDVLTGYEFVSAVSDEQEVNLTFIRDITSKGFTRYPVYRGKNRSQIVGILLSKKLIGVEVDKNLKVKDLRDALRYPVIVQPNMPLSTLFQMFQRGKTHMAIVTERSQEMQTMLGLNENSSVINPMAAENVNSLPMREVRVLGIVTMETILEKVLGKKIVDDYDNGKKDLRMRVGAFQGADIPKNAETQKLLAASFFACEGGALHNLLSNKSIASRGNPELNKESNLSGQINISLKASGANPSSSKESKLLEENKE